MKNFLKNIVVSIITWEAKTLLKRHKPLIIGITGSVGKTGTKDAIYAAIKNSVSARKSEKSFNSDIGVAVTILGINNAWGSPFLWLINIVDAFFIALFSKDYPAVLVLEMGIDRPGDMERLTAWVKPDIAVITRLPNVPVHVEYFGSKEAVAEEKMKLAAALKPEGTLVYNNDDELITAQLPNILARAIGFSRYTPSDFTASADKITYRDDRIVGMECTISHAGESAVLAIADTVGTHHVYSAAAAVAVADVLGIPMSESIAALKDQRTPNGRMRILPGIKSTTIIDDTYNASPVAVEAALEALAEVRYSKRKIAVLGDMLELGRFSSSEHERIGALVPKSADFLVTVGVRSRKIAEAALDNGMAEENILQYEDSARAGRELQSLVQSGDVLLIKASQGIRAERIVEELMASPERASELLVRQDSEWLKRD